MSYTLLYKDKYCNIYVHEFDEKSGLIEHLTDNGDDFDGDEFEFLDYVPDGDICEALAEEQGVIIKGVAVVPKRTKRTTTWTIC